MKREDLIRQLELLPTGSEIYVKRGDRIAEPFLCIYDTAPYPEPMKLVGYIETFADRLEGAHSDWTHQLTKPRHDYLHEVCHHGRDVMGTCLGCSEEEEEWEEDE